jgi:hypothetical protein
LWLPGELPVFGLTVRLCRKGVDAERVLGHTGREVTDSPALAADLKDKLSKAEAKVIRTRTAYETAVRERDEFHVAMKVLIKHGYIQEEGSAPYGVFEKATGAGTVALNEDQTLVLDSVPYGEQFATPPRDVVNIIHAGGRDDLSGDYIRTTLWRLARRDILKSANGLYWRPLTSENVEAPDAHATEASDDLGPVTGRGRVFPAKPPEGSIPSGSTPSNVADDFDSLLDDDVPF